MMHDLADVPNDIHPDTGRVTAVEPGWHRISGGFGSPVRLHQTKLHTRQARLRLPRMVETGPQRAQRRAEWRGLMVGALVRVSHPDGAAGRLHFGMQQAGMVPKHGRGPTILFPRHPRPQVLTPLDFGQRAERYSRQTGASEMTARQYRRARAKTRRAVARWKP